MLCYVKLLVGFFFDKSYDFEFNYPAQIVVSFLFLLLLFWVLQITSSNNSLLLVVIWKNFFPPSCGTFCMLWSCCYSFFSSSKLKICVIAQIIMQGDKEEFLVFVFYPTAPPPAVPFPPCVIFLSFLNLESHFMKETHSERFQNGDVWNQ